MDQAADEAAQNGRGGAGAVVRSALQQFNDVTGQQAVAASGLRRDGEGWSVLVEVVELERIPDTTSVMATYRVDIDSQGDLTGFERLRRYTRGAVDRS